MAYDNNGGRGDRQMFQGNWTCAQCGGAINELPFEPRDTSNLFCRDCHRAKQGDRPRRERRMFEGNWACAKCGTPITQLPFEPRDASTVLCRDCYKK